MWCKTKMFAAFDVCAKQLDKLSLHYLTVTWKCAVRCLKSSLLLLLGLCRCHDGEKTRPALMSASFISWVNWHQGKGSKSAPRGLATTLKRKPHTLEYCVCAKPDLNTMIWLTMSVHHHCSVRHSTWGKDEQSCRLPGLSAPCLRLRNRQNSCYSSLWCGNRLQVHSAPGGAVCGGVSPEHEFLGGGWLMWSLMTVQAWND